MPRIPCSNRGRKARNKRRPHYPSDSIKYERTYCGKKTGRPVGRPRKKK